MSKEYKTMFAVRIKSKKGRELWQVFVLFLFMAIFFGIIFLLDYYFGGGIREIIKSK